MERGSTRSWKTRRLVSRMQRKSFWKSMVCWLHKAQMFHACRMAMDCLRPKSIVWPCQHRCHQQSKACVCHWRGKCKQKLKIASSVSRHIFGISVEDEGKIMYWEECNVGELQHSCVRNVRLWTGHAEMVLPNDHLLSSDNLIEPTILLLRG